MQGSDTMKKRPKKNCGINIRVTEEQRREIQQLAALSGKESVTDFILSTVFDTSFAKPKNDGIDDMLALLKKHFSDVRDFQEQQQVTMYIILQFVMWIRSRDKSREDVMDFYNEQYEIASKRFGIDN